MAEALCPPSRSRLRTNPAAEYLEIRGADALDLESAETAPAVEFDPQLDQFIPYGCFAGTYKNYFKESAERKELFQATLKKFCEHMRKRGGKYASLEMKKLDEYTFQDVWEVVGRLEEEHRSAGKGRMRSIRKFFRKAGENSSALKRLLAFVPDDTYGSAICGGFTIILGALHRAHELREDIYSALEEIPIKLQRIKDWLAVHYRSPDLLHCADGVLVAIFVTLERIVGELTKNVTKKAVMATVKGDRYGADIQEAIKTLDKRIEEFRSQAEVCNAQRLGRVEDGVNLLRQKLKDEAVLREEKRLLEDDKVRESKEYEKTIQGLMQTIKQHELQLAVYNTCYGFLTANPAVDRRTGKVSVKELRGVLEACNPAKTAAGTPPNSVDRWIQDLQRSDIASTTHCEECIRNSWGLNFGGQDKMAWIMGSGELRSWLRSSQFSILVIDSETRPDEILNPLTLSIALVVQTLTTKADFPVLSFFCGLHTNDAYDEELSGPVGMLNCLNAQFLTFMKSRSPGIFLPRLEGDKFRQKSQRHVTEALELLELLVQQLVPNDDAVIVVIESACRLVGPGSKADKALKGITDIAKRAPVAFKVLISDMLSSNLLGQQQVTKLFVPDYIDGDRQGLNLEMVQSEATASTAAFGAHRDVESSGSDGSSSEDDSDSSEDDD